MAVVRRLRSTVGPAHPPPLDAWARVGLQPAAAGYEKNILPPLGARQNADSTSVLVLEMAPRLGNDLCRWAESSPFGRVENDRVDRPCQQETDTDAADQRHHQLAGNLGTGTGAGRPEPR